jgi:hypothetical protein
MARDESGEGGLVTARGGEQEGTVGGLRAVSHTDETSRTPEKLRSGERAERGAQRTICTRR